MSTSATLSLCLIFAFSTIIRAQDCDFDGTSICGWKVGLGDNGPEWRLESQINSTTPNTGPSSDHTNPGVGYFVYLEASLGDPGTSATITSPVLNDHSDINFKFWYHMYGAMGTLNVYIQDSRTDDKDMTLVYTISGDQGDEWKEASIRIANPLHNRIIIEGVKGSGILGDMALDDFTFTNTSSISDGSCDFETDDLCGYRQVLPDELDWARRSGETPTMGTGPPSDHTINNAMLGGFYMYTDASSYGEGDAARMATPTIDPSPAICASFWCYMYGDSSEKGVGSLNVYKRDVDSNVLTNSLLSLHGNQGNRWYELRIDIRSEQEFQIVFEGIRGSSYKSDIAIDDVTIVRNSWCNGSTVPTMLPVLMHKTSKTVKVNSPTTSIKTAKISSSESLNAKFTTMSVQHTTSPDTNRTKIDADDDWLLDRKFVTILVCGLSFWGVIFSIIIINMWRSYRLRKKELFYQLEEHDENCNVSLQQGELVNNQIDEGYGPATSYVGPCLTSDNTNSDGTDITETGSVGVDIPMTYVGTHPSA